MQATECRCEGHVHRARARCRYSREVTLGAASWWIHRGWEAAGSEAMAGGGRSNKVWPLSSACSVDTFSRLCMESPVF